MSAHAAVAFSVYRAWLAPPECPAAVLSILLQATVRHGGPTHERRHGQTARGESRAAPREMVRPPAMVRDPSPPPLASQSSRGRGATRRSNCWPRLARVCATPQSTVAFSAMPGFLRRGFSYRPRRLTCHRSGLNCYTTAARRETRGPSLRFVVRVVGGGGGGSDALRPRVCVAGASPCFLTQTAATEQATRGQRRLTQRRLRRASDVVFDKRPRLDYLVFVTCGCLKPAQASLVGGPCLWCSMLQRGPRVLSCAPQRLSCVAEAPSSLTNSLSPRPASGREARERLRRVSHRIVVSPGGAMISWHHDHACIILCTTAARVCVWHTATRVEVEALNQGLRLARCHLRGVRACTTEAQRDRHARRGWDGTAVLRLRTYLRHRNRSHRQCLAGHSVARHVPASR